MRPKTKSIDKRASVKVGTDNNFITAKGLEKLSLKARKLLYIAISQVRKCDNEFYEFSITPIEFAELMNINVSNVYCESESIAQELRSLGISCQIDDRTIREYNVFSYVQYSDVSDIIFKLNYDMTDFFLNLRKNFSQPLLIDFLQMKSPYSMAIWHLMQREMKSKKPGTRRIEFYLSLEELRQVTGTTAKLKQLVHFKERVLNKALREIKEVCSVKITYSNRKRGRKVIGFDFIAQNMYSIDISEWEKENPEKAEIIKKKAEKLRKMNLKY